MTLDSFDEDSCSGSELGLSSVGDEGAQPTNIGGMSSAQEPSVTNALPSRSARCSRLRWALDKQIIGCARQGLRHSPSTSGVFSIS